MRKKLRRLLVKIEASWTILRQAYIMIRKISKSPVRLIEEQIPMETPNTSIISNNTTSLKNLKGLIEVPEEKIIHAAMTMGDTPNSFHMLLHTAEVYKGMNVEPVFLINKTQDAICVAPREIWLNPYHLN